MPREHLDQLLEDLREVHRELERLAPGKWKLIEKHEDAPKKRRTLAFSVPCIWLDGGEPEIAIEGWITYSIGFHPHYKGLEVHCRDGVYWSELSGTKKRQGYARRKDGTFNVAALLRFADTFVEAYLAAVKRTKEEQDGIKATRSQLREVLEAAKKEDSFGRFDCREDGVVNLALRRSNVTVPVERAAEVLVAWERFMRVVEGEGSDG